MKDNKNTEAERKEMQINYEVPAMEITSHNFPNNLCGRNCDEEFTYREGNSEW